MPRLTPTQARRLAITKQYLAGPRLEPTAAGAMAVFRRLGCVQIDPIRAVERTQYLTLWSRLGAYDKSLLDRLVFEEKQLFEYWAHAASIVLTENYPIHRRQAQRFAQALDGQQGSTAWQKRLGAWFQANKAFHDYVLAEMERHGPRGLADLEDRSVENWESSGWTSNRRVAMMVQMMWERGDLMVVERDGSRKKWDLSDRWLPSWTPREPLSDVEATRRALQIALRALGVATTKQIRNHFTRGVYPQFEEAIAQLLAEGRLLPVQIAGWPDQWYVHADDLPSLDRLADHDWRPHTTLLSPFDNLIADRDRAELMWDFHYRLEIYVPAAKRKFGYYVLPILHGDRLIGRIDPKFDRKAGVLHIHAVYLEDKVYDGHETGAAVAAALADLADWLGASAVDVHDAIPTAWRQPWTTQDLLEI